MQTSTAPSPHPMPSHFINSNSDPSTGTHEANDFVRWYQIIKLLIFYVSKGIIVIFHSNFHIIASSPANAIRHRILFPSGIMMVDSSSLIPYPVNYIKHATSITPWLYWNCGRICRDRKHGDGNILSNRIWLKCLDVYLIRLYEECYNLYLCKNSYYGTETQLRRYRFLLITWEKWICFL